MDVYKEWLGIPEGPRPPDHYELLRLKRFEDDPDKITAHYKKLNGHVRKYATGQYSVQSQELLNEMAKAKLCLTDVERKRDYDEGLGRELPPRTDDFGRQPLLEILVKQGHLSRDQKKEAEEFASKRGLSERDAAVQLKFAAPELAARALAQHLGYSFVELEDMIPEDDILDLVPRHLVKHHSFIPLFIDDGQLLIACVDQPEHELEDELRLRYDVPVRPVIAAPRSINQAISQYYAPGMRDEAKAPAKAATAAPKKGKEKEPAKGKDKPAAKAEKPKAPKGAAGDFASLPVEQRRQKIYASIMVAAWSIVVPMLPWMLDDRTKFGTLGLPRQVDFLPYLAFLIAPIAIGYNYMKYWRYWK